MNRVVQILGISGTLGAWVISNLELINGLLTAFSLIIGVFLGLWALTDRIIKRVKRK